MVVERLLLLIYEFLERNDAEKAFSREDMAQVRGVMMELFTEHTLVMCPRTCMRDEFPKEDDVILAI